MLSYVWRIQVAHLHNVARVLPSPSRCFQLSTNLGKDFFRCLWYCGEKQIECGLAWHWWYSTDLGLIDMFLINLNAEIVACMLLSFRKSRHKPNLEITSKYGFSPDLGEKMAAFWACACKLSWTLLSPARVQPLYGAGKRESSGTGLVEHSKISCFTNSSSVLQKSQKVYQSLNHRNLWSIASI